MRRWKLHRSRPSPTTQLCLCVSAIYSFMHPPPSHMPPFLLYTRTGAHDSGVSVRAPHVRVKKKTDTPWGGDMAAQGRTETKHSNGCHPHHSANVKARVLAQKKTKKKKRRQHRQSMACTLAERERRRCSGGASFLPTEHSATVACEARK